MKQSIFYRCMMPVGTDRCYALRTLGYIEGGIGLLKEKRGWVATHIPTGAKLTPWSSVHCTAIQSLLEAEHLIAQSEDILDAIQKVRSKPGHDAFLADRHKQLLADENDSSDEWPF